MIIGDLVKIKDLAGYTHLATIRTMDRNGWYAVRICRSGITTVRSIDNVEKASDGEAMLWILENR